MRWLSLWVIPAALFISACGSDSTEVSDEVLAIPAERVETCVQGDSSTDFDCTEDLLIPETATELEAYNVDGIYIYQVANLSFDEVRGWYEAQMPSGQPVGDYEWCGTAEEFANDLIPENLDIPADAQVETRYWADDFSQIAVSLVDAEPTKIYLQFDDPYDGCSSGV